MRRLTILFVCTLLLACSTPTELLEKGEVDRAFELAERKLKAGKDVNANSLALIASADQIIQDELYYNFRLTQSPRVKDWVRAQNNYFKTLEDIVVANDLVDGQLQNSYDQLCTEKIELDFKIADHFYENGTDLLATHYERLSKHHAREAYYQYQECLSYGGDRFFQDLQDKKKECILEGRVFFISSNFRPNTNLFFKPLPQNAAMEPDCVISASFGPTSFSTHKQCDVETFTKEIEIGKKTEQDSSGKLIYIPIMKKITASVTTTKYKITATSNTHIYANNLTGQCSKSSKSFNNCVSDTYEEVVLVGDKRALKRSVSECKGMPAFFISNLESDLESSINSRLHSW